MGDRGEPPALTDGGAGLKPRSWAARADAAAQTALDAREAAAAERISSQHPQQHQHQRQHQQHHQHRPRHGGLSMHLQQPHAGRSSSAQAPAAPGQLRLSTLFGPAAAGPATTGRNAFSFHRGMHGSRTAGAPRQLQQQSQHSPPRGLPGGFQRQEQGLVSLSSRKSSTAAARGSLEGMLVPPGLSAQAAMQDTSTGLPAFAPFAIAGHQQPGFDGNGGHFCQPQRAPTASDSALRTGVGGSAVLARGPDTDAAIAALQARLRARKAEDGDSVACQTGLTASSMAAQAGAALLEPAQQAVAGEDLRGRAASMQAVPSPAAAGSCGLRPSPAAHSRGVQDTAGHASSLLQQGGSRAAAASGYDPSSKDSPAGPLAQASQQPGAATPRAPPPKLYISMAAACDKLPASCRQPGISETQRRLKVYNFLAERGLIHAAPGCFSLSTAAASADAAQLCSTPPAAAVAPACTQQAAGASSPQHHAAAAGCASPTKKQRLLQQAESPELAAPTSAAAAASTPRAGLKTLLPSTPTKPAAGAGSTAAGSPAPVVDRALPARRMRLARQFEQLCAGGVPDEQQLAALLVKVGVLNTPAELQLCIAAAAAVAEGQAALHAAKTAAVQLAKACLLNSAARTSVAQQVSSTSAQQVNCTALIAPAALVTQLCQQLSSSVSAMADNPDAARQEVRHNLHAASMTQQYATALDSLLAAAAALEPVSKAASAQLQGLVSAPSLTGLLPCWRGATAVLRGLLGSDVQVSVATVEECAAAGAHLECVVVSIVGLADSLQSIFGLLQSLPASVAAAPAAAAAPVSASAGPSEAAKRLLQPAAAAAAAPADCLLQPLPSLGMQMSRIKAELPQAMQACRNSYNAAQPVRVKDPQRYVNQHEVASAAVMQELLQKASRQALPLAQLDLSALPPFDDIDLLEGEADQELTSASALQHSHVLTRSSLQSAFGVIGPAPLRTALVAALQTDPCSLQAVFLTALQLYKEEWSVGAMRGTGLDAAASLKAAVITRLGFVRLLVLMYQVLVRAPPAAAAIAAAAVAATQTALQGAAPELDEAGRATPAPAAAQKAAHAAGAAPTAAAAAAAALAGDAAPAAAVVADTTQTTRPGAAHPATGTAYGAAPAAAAAAAVREHGTPQAAPSTAAAAAAAAAGAQEQPEVDVAETPQFKADLQQLLALCRHWLYGPPSDDDADEPVPQQEQQAGDGNKQQEDLVALLPSATDAHAAAAAAAAAGSGPLPAGAADLATAYGQAPAAAAGDAAGSAAVPEPGTPQVAPSMVATATAAAAEAAAGVGEPAVPDWQQLQDELVALLPEPDTCSDDEEEAGPVAG